MKADSTIYAMARHIKATCAKDGRDPVQATRTVFDLIKGGLPIPEAVAEPVVKATEEPKKDGKGVGDNA